MLFTCGKNIGVGGKILSKIERKNSTIISTIIFEEIVNNLRYRHLGELQILFLKSARQGASFGTTFAYIGGGRKFDQNSKKSLSIEILT